MDNKNYFSEEVNTFLNSEHKLLIGADWTEAEGDARFDSFDPGTGRKIATLHEASNADVDRAVAAARKAFEGEWSRATPAGRANILLKWADLIEKNGEFLAEVEVADNGKPLKFARAGIAGTVDMVRYMAGWATKLNGQAINISVPGNWHAFTRREPIGVVGQITPWNYPISTTIWKIAPALAAGCTVVLKPAEQTSLNPLILGRLLQEAGVPDGVVNILTGRGATTGAYLAAHPDVDKIAFTGSTGTGRKIVQAALGNLKKVSLELGGKSPVFVMPDADLDFTIPGVAAAAFNNSGQICSAGTRIFAHSDVYDRVVEGVAKVGDGLKLGHGMNSDVDLGPLISDVQLERVSQMVERGHSDGARTAGGSPMPNMEGYFYPPTVLVDTRPDMEVVREEIFGPVVCIIPFDDQDIDAMAHRGNDTEYGLFASIWTKDTSRALRLAEHIKAGSVSINAHMVNEPALPFGGYKQSGWGRERGEDVFELYTETKSVAVNLGA